MNRHFISVWVLAAGVFVLSGCSRNGTREEGDSAAADSGRDYSQVLRNVRERSAQSMAVDRLNRSIEDFRMERGRQPTNLTELVRYGYIDEIPEAPPGTAFVFNPTNSTLILNRVPSGRTPASP